MARPSVEERFWAKVDRSGGPAACWPWRGYCNPKGYGYFGISNTKRVQAHRFVYRLVVGPIPDGLTIDHVKERGCTLKSCCNPGHMEPVTNRENILRGGTFQGVNARKTHCKRGHPFDEANTYRTAAGSRRCRTCDREAARKARHAPDPDHVSTAP